MKMANKVALAEGGAGIDAIRIVEQDVPAPGPGEALVRLSAATLNFRDLLFVSGRLKGMAKTPDYVPLSCATGEVVAIGDGVTSVSVGDRVNPTFNQGQAPGAPMPFMLGGNADGVARQWAVFPAEYLCRVPDELGDLEAATLACAGLTAWSALFGKRPIQAGETVLVQGTGGVSLAALQWAKAAGATVVITSSSDAKLRRAAALGADQGVNYRTEADWAGAVGKVLGGRGVDIVVDVAGASQVQAAANLLNDGGIIAAIGMLDGDFSWNVQLDKTLVPISVGTPEQHAAMLAFAARHGVRPVVDMVYDLDRIGDALHRLESGRFFGKIGIALQ